MLDLKFIRECPEVVKKALKDRGLDLDVDKLLDLDGQRRKIITEVEALKSERNKTNQEIGQLLREKKDASKLLDGMKDGDNIAGFCADFFDNILDKRKNAVLFLLHDLPISVCSTNFSCPGYRSDRA